MSNEIKIIEEAFNVAAVKGCFNLNDSTKINHCLNVLKRQNEELNELYKVKEEMCKTKEELCSLRKEIEYNKALKMEVVDPKEVSNKPMPKNNKSDELKPVKHK